MNEKEQNMEKQIKIALAGNPNSGKRRCSTL